MTANCGRILSRVCLGTLCPALDKMRSSRIFSGAGARFLPLRLIGKSFVPWAFLLPFAKSLSPHCASWGLCSDSRAYRCFSLVWLAGLRETFQWLADVPPAECPTQGTAMVLGAISKPPWGFGGQFRWRFWRGRRGHRG